MARYFLKSFFLHAVISYKVLQPILFQAERVRLSQRSTSFLFFKCPCSFFSLHLLCSSSFFCLVDNSWIRFLVNISTVLNFDFTKIILTILFSTCSLMKCYLTDMCLICWLKTGLFARDIAPIYHSHYHLILYIHL